MIGEFQSWLAVVATALGVASMLYTWLTSRSKNNASEIEALKQAEQALRERMSSLESDVAHIPTKDSVHMLELSVATMQGDIKAMSEQFGAVQRSTNRIEQYLLEAAK